MTELLRKAKESAKNRTDEERFQLLVNEKILTKEGYFDLYFL